MSFRSLIGTGFVPACVLVAALSACGGGSDPVSAPLGSSTPGNGTSSNPLDVKLTAAQMNDNDLNTALYQAKVGATITLPAGKFTFKGPLTLDVSGVTVQGQGSGKDPSKDTILSFAGAPSKNGVQVRKVDGVVLRGFAVEDAVGNAVFVQDSQKVVMDNLRAEWTDDPTRKSQMAYGLYPVNCQGVIVKNSKVVGTSDAGVYVGQSTNIRVQNNEAYLNVAGVEIENSTNAIVEDNYVHDNTGGILVFSLPGAYVIKKNANTLVRNNRIINNNQPTALNAAGYVTAVPVGTGVMVLAADNTEIVGNTIDNHLSTAILAVSFQATGFPYNDPTYDPFVRAVYAHGNAIKNTGAKPGGAFASPPLNAIVEGLFAQLGAMGAPQLFPAGVWDGILDPSQSEGLRAIPGFAPLGVGGTAKPAMAVCIKGNTLDTPNIPGQLSYEAIDLNLIGLQVGQAIQAGQLPSSVIDGLPADVLDLHFPFPSRLDCTLTLPAIPPMPVF